jgi:hypothetical protein
MGDGTHGKEEARGENSAGQTGFAPILYGDIFITFLRNLNGNWHGSVSY